MGRVRQRRSAWVGICVVVVFFTGVTLAFAWLGGGPDIPHAVDGDRAACTICHPTSGLPDGSSRPRRATAAARATRNGPRTRASPSADRTASISRTTDRLRVRWGVSSDGREAGRAVVAERQGLERRVDAPERPAWGRARRRVLGPSRPGLPRRGGGLAVRRRLHGVPAHTAGRERPGRGVRLWRARAAAGQGRPRGGRAGLLRGHAGRAPATRLRGWPAERADDPRRLGRRLARGRCRLPPTW